jgi:helix-turn-helix protein
MMSGIARQAYDQAQDRQRPTIDDIRAWPATCDVPDAAGAVGVSRTTAYELVKTGDFPAKVIKVVGRYRVLTASLLAVLTGETEVGAQAR